MPNNEKEEEEKEEEEEQEEEERNGREACGSTGRRACRQRSPRHSAMMDAFMNDPTEPRTSLLLLPSSFSYFIFTFLDRP